MSAIAKGLWWPVRMIGKFLLLPLTVVGFVQKLMALVLVLAVIAILAALLLAMTGNLIVGWTWG